MLESILNASHSTLEYVPSWESNNEQHSGFVDSSC